LLFGPEDGGTTSSPTVYASFRGERPIVSGGLEIRGWKKGMLGAQPVLMAEIPAAAGPLRIVRQLWVNGVRRAPARFPNRGYLQVESAPEVTDTTEWMDGQKSLVPRTGDISSSMDARGSEAVVMNRWVESHLPVETYNPKKNLLSFTRRSVFRLEKGDPFYMIHVQSALDTIGEWFHDNERGILYA
jgi:hypothetical protein